MKKVIFSFGVLLSSLTYGQDINGEIHYMNGYVKKGLVESVIYSPYTKKIKYKLNKDSKKETIDLSQVKKLVYFFDDGTTRIAEKINYRKRFYPWVMKYREAGNLKVYTATFKWMGNKYMLPSVETYYFAKYKDETADDFFYTSGISLKAANKKTIKKFFKDKCSKLVEAVDEIEYKEHYPDPYIDYFEKHCK